MTDPHDRNPADHLKGHRWAKGRSGNPGGRPKGKSVSAALRALAKTTHNGKAIAVLLAERLVKEALSGGRGSFPFLKEAVERLEGKVETAAEAAAAKPPPPPQRWIKVVLMKDGVETPYDESPPPLPPAGEGRENVRVVPPPL